MQRNRNLKLLLLDELEVIKKFYVRWAMSTDFGGTLMARAGRRLHNLYLVSALLCELIIVGLQKSSNRIKILACRIPSREATGRHGDIGRWLRTTTEARPHTVGPKSISVVREESDRRLAPKSPARPLPHKVSPGFRVHPCNLLRDVH